MDLFFLIIVVVIGLVTYLYLKRRTQKDKITGFGIKTEANDGTLLDSKQEKQVADYLDKQNIQWTHGENIKVDYIKYELLNKISFGLIKTEEVSENIKTDFVIPTEDEKIYIEYFGMINVQGKVGKQYRKRHKEKLKLYKIGNLPLVSIYPENLDNLDSVFPNKLKQASGHKISKIKKIHKQIIFCNDCGNQLPKNSKFCDGCGTAI